MRGGGWILGYRLSCAQPYATQASLCWFASMLSLFRSQRRLTGLKVEIVPLVTSSVRDV